MPYYRSIRKVTDAIAITAVSAGIGICFAKYFKPTCYTMGCIVGLHAISNITREISKTNTNNKAKSNISIFYLFSSMIPTLLSLTSTGFYIGVLIS